MNFLKSLKSIVNPTKIDIKDVSDTKKPVLLFNVDPKGYFDPENENLDIKDNTKITELEKHFSIPYPYIYRDDHPKIKEDVDKNKAKMIELQQEIDKLKEQKKKEPNEHSYKYDWAIEDVEKEYKRCKYYLDSMLPYRYYRYAYEVYEDIYDTIFNKLNTTRWNSDRLCKGLGSDVLDERIIDSRHPDIIITIFAGKAIIGFAYIEIKEQYTLNIKNVKKDLGKVLKITAICSDDSFQTEGGKSIKGIGTSLIDSVEKIGKVFNCNTIVVDSPRDTTTFFEKIGFASSGVGNVMIMDLYNYEIKHVIIDDTDSSKKGGKKSGKSLRKSNKKAHKHTRKSR